VRIQIYNDKAVPTLKPAKPGWQELELGIRVVSDIGHGLQAKRGGFVSYVDGNFIRVYSK
jgi:hypothetical protein